MKKVSLIFIKSFLFLFLIGSVLNAQDLPILSPLDENIEIKNNKEPLTETAKRGGGTLSLPFFDDFSYPGPWPDPQNWADRDVFINETLGANPVSIGVASFDGVDSSGAPYGGPYGPSDHLTSRPVNLLTANPNNLYLTFYLQAGGNSFKPENIDSLVLQFLDPIGNWNSVNKFKSNSFSNTDSFYFISQKLDPVYYQSSFRFRFINYSENDGITDVWNLDYIKLAEEGGGDLRRETDIAFTLPPRSILKAYTAMPWRHFYGFGEQELRTDYTVELYNHANMTLQADSSFLSVREKSSGRAPIQSETLLELPPAVPENQRDLAPGRHRFVNEVKTSGYIQRYNDLFDLSEENIVLSKDFIFRQSQEGTFGTRSNNAVSSKTVFANYFAYDDGSAESGIQFNYGGNNQPSLAVRFRTNVSDTIRALQLMFPHTADGDQRQEFRLNIWGVDLNAGPIYTSPVMTPVFVHEELGVDSVQGLTTFDLTSPLTGNDTLIPVGAGIFYAGWTQVSSSSRGVLIGFDKNNPDASGNNFYNNGTQWLTLDSISPFFDGAVIIRPVTTASPYVAPTPTVDPPSREIALSVYPNPARYRLNLRLDGTTATDGYRYEIFGLDGRLHDEGRAHPTIDITHLSEGIYFIRIRSEKADIFGVTPFEKIK